MSPWRKTTWRGLALVAGAFLAGVALMVFVLLSRSQSDESQQITVDNRAVSCAIARLVSYVPAFQFEGEPRSNFVGWIKARGELLAEVRERGGCPDATAKLLRDRVRLDEQLLQDLDRKEEP